MTKFALYTYSTGNIGDEIQSLAAKRFIPQVDYYINRDSVGEFIDERNDDEIKLIGNGWYMHSPYAWPPRDENLSPLLLSMFIDVRDPEVEKTFFSDASKKYLTNYGSSIGARDKVTEQLFQEHGIPSYWSGCVTLTLKKDERFKQQDFILAVDISDEIYDYLKLHTNREIIRMSPYFEVDLTKEERFLMAEYFLFLYQSAHAIVTSRLHCMLPSLAFNTPVLFIETKGKYQKSRYAGLEELVRHTTEEEYLSNYDLFDVDTPGENSSEYLRIRKKLTDDISTYTGYDAAKLGISYTSVDFTNIGYDLNFIQLVQKFMSTSFVQFQERNTLRYQKDEIAAHYGILLQEKLKIEQENADLKQKLSKNKTFLDKIFSHFKGS
ncbi:hypothetical protein RyT2_03810 [Pseudolactococcus yaeyamensis]